jgi:hypothetical protein
MMPEATFDYAIRGRLMAPAGTRLNDTASGIILPDGREIKIWEQLELREGDDYRDLTAIEAEELGLFYDGDGCELDPIDLGAETQLWPPR